jgi:hypothetical protein|nr:hypothetical protein [Kofleriaceae bacterium]
MSWRSAAIFAALLAAGCVHERSQDATTGPDGFPAGAVPIVLDHGSGSASDDVSYATGDRVDWKLVELPAKQAGALDFDLQWQPAAHQLALDVFDAYGAQVYTDRRVQDPARGPHVHATIDDARGSYLARVYAVDRADAGTYQLAVAFVPRVGFDPATLEVADPPRLPAVPGDCDEAHYDAKNPDCKDVCPTPADAANAACQGTMACPSPPDRRVRACAASAWPPCDLARRDPQNPNCDHASVLARIVRVERRDADTYVTLGAGKAQGVTAHWTGAVLRADTDNPLAGGAIALVRVDDKVSVGRVKLTTDQLKDNDRVRLAPP